VTSSFVRAGGVRRALRWLAGTLASSALAAAAFAAPVPQQRGNFHLDLRSAATGSALPFTVGQVLRKGDVPEGSTVVSDLAEFQCVVKNRWPDGSAKFAVLSGRADMTSGQVRRVQLHSGTPPQPQPDIGTGELKSRNISAAITYNLSGKAAWAGADWDTPAQTLTTGPQMSSWTYRKPLNANAYLVAWLEVRAYKGGRVEVLPWIENGYLRLKGGGEYSGTATFGLIGGGGFEQELHLLNHQRAVLASGSTLTYWVGGDPQLTPQHDTDYLMSTRQLPNYGAHTASNSPLFDRLASSYTPLAQADFPVYMGASGYHPSIGLLPEWDAAYLTSGADPRAWRAVMINGYAAGRYGIHFRDETTQRPIRFSKYPGLVVADGSGIYNTGSSSVNDYTAPVSGQSPPGYASSHHPSVGAMAYLLSGWNYHLEEAQFLATLNFLKQTDTIRGKTKGVLETTAGANTTRGAAWALRSLALAANFTPDGDALQTEFINSLESNIAHYHQRNVQTPSNPLGLVTPYSNYNGIDDPWESALWMDDFFTASMSYLKDLRVAGGGGARKLKEFLDWKFVSVTGRLGGSGAGAYSYQYAAQYIVPYAPHNDTDWKHGTGPWYPSWADVARAMDLPVTGAPGDPLVSGYPTDPTAYWGNLMPAIAYAVDNKAPGAAEGWARVTAASNWPEQDRAYDDDPVWSVRPRTAAQQ